MTRLGYNEVDIDGYKYVISTVRKDLMRILGNNVPQEWETCVHRCHEDLTHCQMCIIFDTHSEEEAKKSHGELVRLAYTDTIKFKNRVEGM